MGILPPAQFIEQARAQGFVFTVKPGDQLAVKPPVSGVMTDSIRRYVKAQKLTILELLRSSVPAPALAVAVPDPETLNQESTHTPDFLECNAVKSTLTYRLAGCPIYDSLIAWALAEAKKGTLPEPTEALALPSGQVVSADGAAIWLLAADIRASGLLANSKTSADCSAAYWIVRQDMAALANWAKEAWMYLHSPETHQGAYCPLKAQGKPWIPLGNGTNGTNETNVLSPMDSTLFRRN